MDPATPPSDTPPKTRKAVEREFHALAAYGNYHNYYFHRTPTIPDVRLSLLPPALFLHKRVLDLGCNAGKLTMEVVSCLGATSSTGIDIDPFLIDQANSLSAASTVSERCNFTLGDFMQDPPAYFSELKASSPQFDTILLLSITKWLHLHHGDSGLLLLFQALFDYLPPSGTLVIEPQPWSNYKAASKKNPSLRPVFKEIQMRPPFIEEMEKIGFTLEERVEREEGGFSRELNLWRKPGSNGGS